MLVEKGSKRSLDFWPLRLAKASPVRCSAPGLAPAGDQLSVAPESWTKRRSPNCALRPARLWKPRRFDSPVRLEQSRPSRPHSLQRWFRSAGCWAAPIAACRDRAGPRSARHSPDRGGAAVECAALLPANAVRAGQALGWCRKVCKGPFDPIFWPQQKIGRLPGRDPAGCNESAKQTAKRTDKERTASSPNHPVKSRSPPPSPPAASAAPARARGSRSARRSARPGC